MVVKFFQSLLFYIKCLYYILTMPQMNVTIVIMAGKPETKFYFINKCRRAQNPRQDSWKMRISCFYSPNSLYILNLGQRILGWKRSGSKLDSKSVLQRKLLKAPYKEEIENKWTELNFPQDLPRSETRNEHRKECGHLPLGHNNPTDWLNTAQWMNKHNL